MLYYAVSLCTEPVCMDIELVADKRKVEMAVQNINNIYEQIKKNEVRPGTDYLFSGLNDKQREFAKSMEKLNLMNNI